MADEIWLRAELAPIEWAKNTRGDSTNYFLGLSNLPIGEHKKVVFCVFKVPGGQCISARGTTHRLGTKCLRCNTSCARRQEIAREKERERENAEGGAAEGGVGKGERSGWDWGRFLLAGKICWGAFALQCNFSKHVLDNTRFPFPAVAILRKPNTSH